MDRFANTVRLSAVALTFLTAAACGDEPPMSPVITPPAAALPGDGAAPALEALADLLDEGPPPDPSEVSESPEGARILRTRLAVKFDRAATLDEVNAALASAEATVISMLQGVPSVVVRIPDPGDIAGLLSVQAELSGQPGIIRVDLDGPADPARLPDNLALASPPPVTRDRIAHQLAIGGHAVWNARAALGTDPANTPALIVEDYFGDDTLRDGFDVEIIEPSGLIDNRSYSDHGSEVLSVIAAEFGGEDSEEGHVTGLFPRTVRTRFVDLIKDRGRHSSRNLMIRRIEQTPGPVVLNASIWVGLTYEYPTTGPRLQGGAWAEMVAARPGLADRLVVTTCAGNFDNEASIINDYAAAALRDDLLDSQGQPVDGLDGVLVTENLRWFRPEGEVYQPGCLTEKSGYDGNISAIGSDVFMLRRMGNGAAANSGTSFASPQVAALALWVWTLRPDFTGPQVVAHILRMARDAPRNPGPEDPWVHPKCKAPGRQQPAPRIDAYATVLATDRADAPKVRRAILDVDDDGTVDADDLGAFLEAFEGADGAIDYSRFDLNGDGRTGGASGAVVNLDVGGDPRRLELVDVVIEGQTITYDETDATDLDVLCVWAYDDRIFDGVAGQRRDALAATCACPELVLTGKEAGVTITQDGEVPALAGVTGIRELYVRGMGVTDLQGLQCLRQVDQLVIDGTGLLDLDGLEGLREVGRLTITSNPELRDVDALDGLVAITGEHELHSLFITDNPRLTSLDGLRNLQRVDGDLDINDNAALASVGLPALTTVTQGIAIRFGSATSSALSTYRLPALEQAGGVEVQGPGPHTVSLPRLHTIAYGAAISHSGLVIVDFEGTVDLPALRSIDTRLALFNVKALEANLGDVTIEQQVLIDGNATTGPVVVQGIRRVNGQLAVVSSSFGAAFDLAVDDVGSLHLDRNVDLPLAAFSPALYVRSDVQITGNIGFSDDDANAFVGSIRVDGMVRISNNER